MTLFSFPFEGESGLGKSTLINSLFLTDLYPERVIPGAAEKIERTVQIEASTVEIEERGVKLRLTVVDTPGYGDAINCRDWYARRGCAQVYIYSSVFRFTVSPSDYRSGVCVEGEITRQLKAC